MLAGVVAIGLAALGTVSGQVYIFECATWCNEMYGNTFDESDKHTFTKNNIKMTRTRCAYEEGWYSKMTGEIPRMSLERICKDNGYDGAGHVYVPFLEAFYTVELSQTLNEEDILCNAAYKRTTQLDYFRQMNRGQYVGTTWQCIKHTDEPADCCKNWSGDCYSRRDEKNKFHSCIMSGPTKKPTCAAACGGGNWAKAERGSKEDSEECKECCTTIRHRIDWMCPPAPIGVETLKPVAAVTQKPTPPPTTDEPTTDMPTTDMPTPPPVTDKPTPPVTNKPTPRVTAKPTPRVTDKPTPRVTAKPTPRVTAKPTPPVTDKPTPPVTAKPIATTGAPTMKPWTSDTAKDACALANDTDSKTCKKALGKVGLCKYKEKKGKGTCKLKTFYGDCTKLKGRHCKKGEKAGMCKYDKKQKPACTKIEN